MLSLVPVKPQLVAVFLVNEGEGFVAYWLLSSIFFQTQNAGSPGQKAEPSVSGLSCSRDASEPCCANVMRRMSCLFPFMVSLNNSALSQVDLTFSGLVQLIR